MNKALDKRFLSSLRRGLAALNALNSRGRITTGELARHIGVPRTTAHRVLATLIDEGYVGCDEHSHSYHLTSQIRRLADGFNREDRVAEVARPILKQLCAELLMPCGLTTPLGPNMILQVSTDYNAPLALRRLPEGTCFPATYGPSGFLYLAHCSPEHRRQIIALAEQSSGSFRHLNQPPTPCAVDLKRIRDQGYAIGTGAEPTCREGVLAVPVYFKRAYIASLTLRFMNRVYSSNEIVVRHLTRMRQSANAIERVLNATVSDPAQTPSEIS